MSFVRRFRWSQLWRSCIFLHYHHCFCDSLFVSTNFWNCILYHAFIIGFVLDCVTLSLFSVISKHKCPSTSLLQAMWHSMWPTYYWALSFYHSCFQDSSNASHDRYFSIYQQASIFYSFSSGSYWICPDHLCHATFPLPRPCSGS